MATYWLPTLTATVIDSCTLQSTRESGGQAEYDGAKRCKGSKAHLTVDTLGNLLTLHVTLAHQQDREQVAKLAQTVQEVTGGIVEVRLWIRDTPANWRRIRRRALEWIWWSLNIPRPNEDLSCCLDAGSWQQRSIAWAVRFRLLTRDYERLADTLAGFHFVAACLMLSRSAAMLGQGS